MFEKLNLKLSKKSEERVTKYEKKILNDVENKFKERTNFEINSDTQFEYIVNYIKSNADTLVRGYYYNGFFKQEMVFNLSDISVSWNAYNHIIFSCGSYTFEHILSGFKPEIHWFSEDVFKLEFYTMRAQSTNDYFAFHFKHVGTH